MLLMGATTTAIGVLPTYAQAGLAAPALLATLRVLQGLAVGAEWGGAALLSVEHAPRKARMVRQLHATRIAGRNAVGDRGLLYGARRIR